MLSLGIIAPAGMGYYVETVGSGVDDYYARTEPGVWLGAGAAELGLTGEVDSAQIDALVEGSNPVTGDPLGARPTKVAAFDLTFSVPRASASWPSCPTPTPGPRPPRPIAEPSPPPSPSSSPRVS